MPTFAEQMASNNAASYSMNAQLSGILGGNPPPVPSTMIPSGVATANLTSATALASGGITSPTTALLSSANGLQASATSLLSGAAGSAASLGSSALAGLTAATTLSASNILSSSASSLLAGATNQITSGLNTTVGSLSTLKVPVSDPVAAMLGKPAVSTGSSASTYITSPYAAQINPVNLSTPSKTSTTKLAAVKPTQLSAMSARAGVSIPTSDAGLVGLTNTIMSSVTSLAQSAVSSVLGSALSVLPPAIAAPISAVISSAQATFVNTYASQLSGVPNAPVLLANNYNTSYGLTTDSSGNPIPGIPTTTDPSLVTTLNTAMQTACPGFTSINANATAGAQSYANTLLGLVLDNNMGALFDEFMSCSKLFNHNSVPIVTSRLGTMAVSGQSALLAASVAAVGGAAITGAASLIQGLCSSSTPDTTVSSDVLSIMAASDQTPASVYGDTDLVNDQTLWNATSISSGNPTTTSSVVGSDLFDMSSVNNSSLAYAMA